MEAGLLLGTTSATPSAGRWGTTATSNAAQCAGFLLHDLVPRCIQEVFTPTRNDECDETDYRQMVQQKVRRVHNLAGDLDYKLGAVLRCWCSATISHLWQRLQFLDAQGSSLFHASDARFSPFRAAINELAAMVSDPLTEGAFALVIRHFELEWAENKDQRGWFIRTARLILASQAAQLWWRFVIKYEAYPYKLLWLVHPRYSEQERAEVAEQVFRLEPCCLNGDYFTPKAQALHVCNMLHAVSDLHAIRAPKQHSRTSASLDVAVPMLGLQCYTPA